MIPLKLQLRNFISYGTKTQTIDFEPYNLICLIGRNGHGKSALLDALTWVLWGQARKVGGSSKADEGLLRLGETNMMVCLDFICNKIMYRIRREFSLIGKKPFSVLEFGILDQPVPGDPTTVLRPLTDKTIRATQEKIDTLIGLNYESFINSAFLRQGQSNEFSKKTPKERKDILGSILGLDKFEKLKKLSLEKSKEAHTKKEYSSRAKEQLLRSLEQKGDIVSQLDQVSEYLTNMTQKDLSLRTTLQKIKTELTTISSQKNLITQLNFEIAQIDSAINDNITQVLDIFKQRQEIFRRKKELSNIKDMDLIHAALLLKRQELQQLAHEKFSLMDQHFKKKEEERKFIERTNEQFAQKNEKNKLHIQEYQTNLKNIDQRLREHDQILFKSQEEYNQLKATRDHLTQALSPLSTSVECLEKQLIRRKDHYHKYSAHIKMIEQELAHLSNKQQLIHQENDPACPLCKQAITLDRKQQLMMQSEKQIQALTYKQRKLHSYTMTLKELILEQNKDIQVIKKTIEDQKILRIKLDECERQLLKIEQEIVSQCEKKVFLESNYKKLEQELHSTETLSSQACKEYEEQLQNAPTLRMIRQELNAIHQAIKDIDTKLLEEASLNAKIAELEELKQKHMELIKALALQEQKKTTIQQLCKQTQKLKLLRKEKMSSLAKSLPLIQQEARLTNEEVIINQQLQAIGTDKESCMLKKGSLEQQLSVIKQKEVELIEQKKLIIELEQSSEDYKAISHALGKDGIQALLIEDAIPEIEHEANALLSRLTDNQSHLSIESVRDLKTGGTKETLDIKISDPIGVRPYELFSGGEAFRIDFALRIAISKLLARRAGTSLETLIIDEGFGSQDEEGLGSIMEVIYKIQNDFEKVIIVSHLTSMKEQFPVNFLVHKGPQGSQIKVIDQG